jgi:hypothetical protein
MQPVAPWQNKRLHALINQLGIQPEEKAAFVQAVSAKDATSSKELLFSEAAKLIQHLETLAAGGNEAQAESANRMRAKLLSMAHELRWTLIDGKVDMVRLNNWCKARGYGKKRLNDYTYDELNKLVSQLRIVRDNFLKSLTT